MRRISLSLLSAPLVVLLALVAVPFALLAQAAPPLVVPDGSPWYLALLVTVFPIASGWLSNLIMDGVRQLSAKIDTSSVVVKQIVSVLIAVVVSWLTSKFGATIDPDLHNWTALSVNALLTVLAQQGIYRWKAANVAAAQGAVTTAQRRMGLTSPTAR